MPPEAEAGEQEVETNEVPTEQFIDLDAGEDEETEGQTDAKGDSDGQPDESQAQEGMAWEASDESEEQQEEEGDQDLAKLKADNEKLQKDLNRAYYNLRKAEKDKTSTEEPEVEFTDAQILDLMEKHSDEPAVLLQIMKQVSTQQGKAQAVDAVKAQEIKQTRQQIDGFISENFSQYMDESSQEYNELTKAQRLVNVEDHPFGDFIGLACMNLMRMPDIQKEAYEAGKAEALKENGERTRKRAIKESGLVSGKQRTKPAQKQENAPQYKANVKQMNMSPAQAKIYKKLLKEAKAQSVTVSG